MRIARRLLLGILFLLCYFLASSLLELHGILRGAVFWLPTGVALAGLWLMGLRWWPIVFIGTMLSRLGGGYLPQHAVIPALGNTLEALAGVFLLQRLGFSGLFRSLRDSARLLIVAGVAPLVSATIGTLPIILREGWQWQRIGSWWAMNALGILLMVPFALTWLQGSIGRPSWRTVAEVLGIVAVTSVLSGYIATTAPHGELGLVTSYLALPIAFYAAIRFGVRGAATAALVISILAVVGTMRGVGPFTATPLEARQLGLQGFVLILAGGSLVLATMAVERTDAGLRETRSEAERSSAERLLAWQAGVLELVATGHPLPEVLTALARGIEELEKENLCSVLLLEGRLLRVAAGPSLPAAYNAAIDGVEMGPRVGSCGTAAWHNQTVVVADIGTDPLWEHYRDLALGHGLRSCWSVPIRNAGGGAVGSFAIYSRTVRAPNPQDLALVERAAAIAGIAVERERREGLLASINRNVNEGLFRGAPVQGLLYVNDACARMFGFGSPAEMLSVPTTVLYQDPARQHELAGLIERDGCFTSQEVRFVRRDGSFFWGLMSSTVVRWPGGAIQYFDGAIADITARKQLEEQLRQAQKMEAVGKLAGGVAHDFNNLLTAITGYAEGLTESVPAGQPREDLDEILRAAGRAAGLTRQLLAFGRQQVLSPQVINLTAVVGQLSGMLRRLIGEDIRFVVQHSSAEANVRVDRGQIEQVILNLVLNARDAMPAGGTLTILTEPVDLDRAFAARHVDVVPGPHVCLSVSDTGVGMNAETQSRAFDPFFTTKDPGKGTGLGLSTVYGIVRQSDGSIWLESTPGAGTTVRVYFARVAEAPAPPVAAPPAVAADASSGTVLVAEDERLVRDLVSRALRRAGFTVMVAEDGEDALQVARRHAGPIDLLVTDVVMPHMGGRELAEQLHLERPGLRVLFVSGYPGDSASVQGSLGVGYEYLQKPFTPAELLDKVRRTLSVTGVPS